MSRRCKLLIVWFLAALYVASPVYAVDETVRAEIVYRANLGRADDVKLLVSQGASPDQIDAKGTPLLALAAVRTDPEGLNIIKALVEVGANINLADPSGQNALFYAAKAGNIEAAKLLLVSKIDYQAIDASGDTARVEASRAGHPEILTLIDDFVRGQNAKAEAEAKVAGVPDNAATLATSELAPIVDSKSEAAAEARIQEALGASDDIPKVAESPKTATEEQTREPFEIDEKKLENSGAASDQDKAFDDIIKHGIKATEPAAKTSEQLAVDAEAAKQAQKAKDVADEKRKAEVKHMAYDVAYHTCAFQYWAYCLEIKQSSELASEEMAIAIETQKDEVEEVEKKMLVDYHLPSSFYDNITNSAQLRIYDQLNAMKTNRVRHENGVGKMDDMENRCEEIGRQWGFPAAIKPQETEDASAPATKNKSSAPAKNKKNKTLSLMQSPGTGQQNPVSGTIMR